MSSPEKATGRLRHHGYRDGPGVMLSYRFRAGTNHARNREKGDDFLKEKGKK